MNYCLNSRLNNCIIHAFTEDNKVTSGITMKLLMLLLRRPSGSVILLCGIPLFFSSTILSPQPMHTQTHTHTVGLDVALRHKMITAAVKRLTESDRKAATNTTWAYYLVQERKWAKKGRHKAKRFMSTYSTIICHHGSVWRKDGRSWGGTVASLWDWLSPTAESSHHCCMSTFADWDRKLEWSLHLIIPIITFYPFRAF